MKNKQQGVTLVEILVSLAVLGATIGGISSLQYFSLKQTQSIYQRTEFVKVISALDTELFKEMDAMPYRENSDSLIGNSFDSAAVKDAFDDSQAQKICFNSSGFRVEESHASCEVKVAYFKLREEDRLYSLDSALNGSNFKSTPISRLLYRVTYKDKGDGQTRTYYFNRLKTHVITM